MYVRLNTVTMLKKACPLLNRKRHPFTQEQPPYFSSQVGLRDRNKPSASPAAPTAASASTCLAGTAVAAAIGYQLLVGSAGHQGPDADGWMTVPVRSMFDL